MTLAELIDLGFDKVDILNEESDNGFDYHFYQKEVCPDIVVYSTDSIDVVNDEWTLFCYEIPSIKIATKNHYLQFEEVIKNITCE